MLKKVMERVGNLDKATLEIIPEVWLLSRHGLRVEDPCKEEIDGAL